MTLPQSDLGNLALATMHVNNTDELLVAMSAQVAGTTTYGPFYNPKRALRIAINIGTITAGSLTVTLLGYDNSSGAAWTVLASAALSSAGLTLIEVGPNVAASANVIAQDYAPAFYQIKAVIATGVVTGTIGAHGLGA
jgi:hypothetical protein